MADPAYDPDLDPGLTRVTLSTERTDEGTPSPPSPPGPFLPPQWPSPPPPSGPPTILPPPPPGGPGGGIAAQAPPVPAPVYVTNHYYPAVPEAPARQGRFRISRLHPAWNVSALVAGLLLVPDTSRLMNLFGDEYGVMMGALALTGLLELRFRGRSWLVRVLTCNLVASSAVTAAGLHMYGVIVTGV
ncbi:hypothetical protein [Streptomyces noursei]|uniref:hypothetical protein n=1 Tax=Streptomyces noursei TaxID=1971 RepID=UPI001673345E|nr:hypothetical protein [Streptomyces noursei]MCZ1021317.1 hypothetical protein [Streptomyces noursei]GGX55798.1 hypothetical protein GCM10010341_90650 [Streptomyces noursei]